MDKEGTTVRDHLEAAAAQGSESALEELESVPECPEEVEYLVAWAYELFGRSGVSMSGANPLNPAVVEAWSRLLELEIEPYEVRALLALDAVLREQATEDKKEAEPSPAPSWPRRRNRATE